MTTTNNLNETLEKYKSAYQVLHEDKNHFRGYSLKQYLPEISALIRDSNIKTVLDYGCGKAELHDAHRLKPLWKLELLDKYDPGVVEWCTPPTRSYDLVVCTDVLEHIEEEDLDQILRHIYSLTNKVLFASISTRPASKKLPDGTNAHKTIQPDRWWKDKLNEIFHDKLVIAFYTQ